jgi:hypothetical protein
MCGLYDLHQDRDQRWRWHGASMVSNNLLVSRRAYDSRQDAQLALTRFLRMTTELS